MVNTSRMTFSNIFSQNEKKICILIPISFKGTRLSIILRAQLAMHVCYNYLASNKGQAINTIDVCLLSSLPLLYYHMVPWWRHNMELLYALLVFCGANLPISSGQPSQRHGNAICWYFSTLLAIISCWTDNEVAIDFMCHNTHAT